ncbi:MAG: sulfurtransferase/chromate resistance protein [Rhodobacteraceae bacterium]|nr:sulfurtransferase/chromate resistance protein [Paracoccaceae bacterium]
MASPIEISVPQLLRRIGLPDQPVLIDVCQDDDFAEDPRVIPTARRWPFGRIEELLPQLQGKSVVIICRKGKKLSQGAVALLRSHGIKAEALAGGMVAWRQANAPMTPVTALPDSNLWVTRFRPKIDRIACPWLIRRFVDPSARFLFVAPCEVIDVAERFNATPFDVENVFWTHHDDTCTFDKMVEEFQLHSEAIDRLADVIRAADTNNHDLAPQAAGLLAISVGLSRQYKDDTEQLEAGMAIYDAMYRWARDGFDEGHDWPAGRAK